MVRRGGCIVQLGGFSSSTPLDPVLAFAFEQQAVGSFYLKSTISHEAAHTLGLLHQSEWDGDAKVHEYYAGPDDSSGPIMGAGGIVHHSQWWYGTSALGPEVFQNDFDMIAANDHVGLRPDDIGDGVETASALSPEDSHSIGQGLIGTEADRDYWSFSAMAGRIIVHVETGYHGNLAAHVELRNAEGDIVTASSDSIWGNIQEQDLATITYIASEPGTYYVVVASSGLEAGTTQTSHGINVGSYQITASSAPYSPTQLVLSQPSVSARAAKVVTLAAGAHLQGTDSAIQIWDQITVTIATGGQSGDLIGVKAAGRGSSRLSVNAKQILKLGRSQIGTLTRVSNGIRIDISTPRPGNIVEQVVRQLKFKSGRRAAGTRQAAIVINNTITSEHVDQTVQIGIA